MAQTTQTTGPSGAHPSAHQDAASPPSGATGATGPTKEEQAAAKAAEEEHAKAKKEASDKWVRETNNEILGLPKGDLPPPDDDKDDPSTKPVPPKEQPTSGLSDGDKLWIRREIEGAGRGMSAEQRAELNP